MNLDTEIALTLERIEALGVVQPEAFDDGRVMSMGALTSLQNQEMQSGRWQLMRARQNLIYAREATTDEDGWRLLYAATKLLSEGLFQLHDRKKIARVKDRPDPGGRPPGHWAAILHLRAQEIIDADGCGKAAACRQALKEDPALNTRFGHMSDNGLRKAFKTGAK